MSDDSGALKRGTDRFDVRECTVEARKGSGFLGLGSKEDIGGPIVDMSDTGLRFACTEKPPLETTLRMELSLSPIGKKLSIRSVVKWVTFQGTQAIVGVEFVKLSDKDRDMLAKLRQKLGRIPSK